MPIDERGEFAGTFLTLLRPYPILLGTYHRFPVHDARRDFRAVMKTEGELHDKLRGWINNTIIFFIICYAVTTMATLLYVPHMAARLRANLCGCLHAETAMALAIADIPREISLRRDGRAFPAWRWPR
ncbi:MAG: hypothetical protein U1G07_16975 [Verrucomicrobiota bacterium]